MNLKGFSENSKKNESARKPGSVEDNYSSTTHTVHIRDNDATPQLAFSSDNSVTAVEDSETETSPDINVIVSDGSGNLTPSALPITLSVTNHTSSPGTAVIYSDATTPSSSSIICLAVSFNGACSSADTV